MRVMNFVFLIAILIAPAWAAETADADRFWPSWRGPSNTGVSPAGDPPIEWSETKNIRWKVAIPGEGQGTPIIWGDRVFVTSAIDTGEESAASAPSTAPSGRRRHPGGVSASSTLQHVVFALSRKSGEILWRTTANREKPHEGRHPTGTFASNSAVTDGERLYAYFGSRGLYALDFDGNLLWERDFGDMRKRMGFGEGSSPALFGDTLVVIWDHEDQSFLVALDVNDGSERWRTDRDEFTSWTTPIIVESEGRAQVVTVATTEVRSYDLETGEQLWESRGVTLNAIPSPVYADGIVYLMSGFRGSALEAVKLSAAEGSLEDSGAVLWRYDQDTPYVSSPLLYEGGLYFLKSNNPILTALDAKSGEPLYSRQRVAGLTSIYSSMVGAAGRVYITDRKGSTVVIDAGSEYKVLATNTLDDAFDASAAIVGSEIYLRGANLYCIAAD